MVTKAIEPRGNSRNRVKAQRIDCPVPVSFSLAFGCKGDHYHWRQKIHRRFEYQRGKNRPVSFRIQTRFRRDHPSFFIDNLARKN